MNRQHARRIIEAAIKAPLTPIYAGFSSATYVIAERTGSDGVALSVMDNGEEVACRNEEDAIRILLENINA